MDTTQRSEFVQILNNDNILSKNLIEEFGATIKDDYIDLCHKFPLSDAYKDFFRNLPTDYVAGTSCQEHYDACINIIFLYEINVLSIEKRIGNYYKGNVFRSDNRTFLFKCTKYNWIFDLICFDDFEGIDLEVCNVVNLQTNEKADISCSFFYTSPLHVRNFMYLLSSPNFEIYRQRRFKHVELLQNLLPERKVIQSPWQSGFCKEFDFILTIDDKLHVIVDALEYCNYPIGYLDAESNNTTFVRIFPTLKQLGLDYQKIIKEKREKEKRIYDGIDFQKLMKERGSQTNIVPDFERCFPIYNDSVLDIDNYNQHLKHISVCIPYEQIEDFENVRVQILKMLSEFD
uniref:Uncharacterized protein n=1 Tax=viral metagenome TaxID=1070528 RepID=A0A6C0C6G9_9ZZZZ